MKNHSFQHFVLGFLILLLLVSCKKDTLTITSSEPIVISDCGDEFLDVDVDYHFSFGPPFITFQVCECDTLELSFSNVPVGLTFFEWNVYDPATWIFTGSSPTLILENPNTETVIELLFDDGTSGVFPILIFLEEGPDC